jgi:hypothetical protein
LTKAELILITSERLKLVPLTGKNFNVNIRGAPGLNWTSESATDPGAKLTLCASVDSNCWNIVGFVMSEKAGARKIIKPWKGLVQVQLCEGAGFANWSVGHEIALHGPGLVKYGTCCFCWSVHKVILSKHTGFPVNLDENKKEGEMHATCSNRHMGGYLH